MDQSSAKFTQSCMNDVCNVGFMRTFSFTISMKPLNLSLKKQDLINQICK